MRDVIAMVLAGGRVEDLSVLTAERPKAAVPFAGQYRIIDFAMSGLMRADVARVGVLSLYRPASLIDHLGSGETWDLIGRGRGVKLLPPFKAESAGGWYRGTADAVWQNRNFIRDHAPRDVLILSGDHIYDVDYAGMLDTHRGRDADLTMLVKQMDPAVGRGRFGFAEVDPDDRVIGYQEKPDKPRSSLVSLTVYLFKTDVLLERLEENFRSGQTHQLYSEVLPAMVEQERVFAHRYQGYWNYPRSVDAYHGAHMDLLGSDPAIRLEDWSVRTRKVLSGLGDMPPVFFDRQASCSDCLVSPGVRLSGRVERSVLSPGVRIEAGAVVRDSVLLHKVVVREGAMLDRVVLDKQVEIGAEAQIGFGDPTPPNAQLPSALQSGVTLVGKKTLVPAKTRIGRNCVIYPELTAKDWEADRVASGTCIGVREGGGA
jgi:glucose-1-phosphate adenylyltransferase